MNYNTEVALLGQDELFAKFAELKNSYRSRLVTEAVVDAASLIRDDAKNRLTSKTSRRTNLLRRSLVAKAFRRQRYGDNAAFVAIDGNVKGLDSEGNKVWPVKYAHLVEFGTKARFPKKKQFMVFMGKNGKKIFTKQVAPMPRIPFFRPAIDSKKSLAMTRIKLAVIKQIKIIEKKRAIKAVRGG